MQSLAFCKKTMVMKVRSN